MNKGYKRSDEVTSEVMKTSNVELEALECRDLFLFFHDNKLITVVLLYYVHDNRPITVVSSPLNRKTFTGRLYENFRKQLLDRQPEIT